MTHRERIASIISTGKADKCGFWLGNPHPDTWPIYHKYFGTRTEEELRQKLNDDVRWFFPGADVYKHPEGKIFLDKHRKGKELSSDGCFANCESVQEVEDYEWPDLRYLDFTEFIMKLNNAGDTYRLSGFWSCFFHDVADFFGMENYFIKMYTNPEVVHAVTKHTVDFYIAATRKLFEKAGKLIDGYFFGNDFGTQLSLLISPDCFREFIFPYFKQLTDLGHSSGYSVFLHSCGAIHQVIPDLIRLGVDALHPLQAKARDMDAETLARDFKGKVVFFGAIDTQDLLVNATPDEIRKEVRRVKQLLGPGLIVSPSHEALLPNVPPQNVLAMSEAATE